MVMNYFIFIKIMSVAQKEMFTRVNIKCLGFQIRINFWKQ